MCATSCDAPYRPSLVLLQCLLLELYLILLPVFIRIHWGIGQFSFCSLARNRLILKVLWEDMARSKFNQHRMTEKRRDQLAVFLFIKSGVPTLVTSFKVPFDAPSNFQNAGLHRKKPGACYYTKYPHVWTQGQILSAERKSSTSGESLCGPLWKSDNDRLPQAHLLEKNTFQQWLRKLLIFRIQENIAHPFKNETRAIILMLEILFYRKIGLYSPQGLWGCYYIG